MKLSDWAKKEGISYLTAYRWFKAGKMPVPCYQTDSGTIIVNVSNNQPPNEDDKAVSHLLKKTVEFSNSNAPIEDFAAYVISNYKLAQNLEKGSVIMRSLSSEPINVSNTISTNYVSFSSDSKPESDDLSLPFEFENKVSYDEARLLVDSMVKLNQITNDPIQIDRKAKEICTWSRDMFFTIQKIVLNKGIKNE